MNVRELVNMLMKYEDQDAIVVDHKGLPTIDVGIIKGNGPSTTQNYVNLRFRPLNVGTTYEQNVAINEGTR